jgi:long-chain acyl-CoA synthetase
MSMREVFMTGITGLVGNAIAAKLLRADPPIRIMALVRDAARWRYVSPRIMPFAGDITQPGLGIEAPVLRRLLRERVSHVIHCAADTTFSNPLDTARAVNTGGTAELIKLAGEWDVERFTYVSTAFVAGAHTGDIQETAHDADAGFVNAYEQSKHEAEALVRGSSLPWVIARPSTIVCDDASGVVTQINAVHRALRVVHSGLAAMVPACDDTLVDVTTTSYVASAIADLGVRRGEIGGTYHLCAGDHAMPFGELLDRAFRVWSADSDWVRRGVMRPALTDLANYRLFEQSVEETGDARLIAVTRSLAHFAPQLALPKRFLTTNADAALGYSAPSVSSFWDRIVAQLLNMRWRLQQRSAA